MAKEDVQFSKREIKKRFESALQGAFKTAPTPMKSMSPKGGKRKAKKTSVKR